MLRVSQFFLQLVVAIKYLGGVGGGGKLTLVLLSRRYVQKCARVAKFRQIRHFHQFRHFHRIRHFRCTNPFRSFAQILTSDEISSNPSLSLQWLTSHLSLN